jgi:hypothetical protein
MKQDTGDTAQLVRIAPVNGNGNGDAAKHAMEQALATPVDEFEGRFAEITLADVSIEVQEFLIEPFLIDAGFQLLVGREGVGKGLTVAYLIARITKNGGDDGVPSHVGMIVNEDSLRRQLKPRLVAAGADPDKVHLITRPKQASDDHEVQAAVDLPADIGFLERWIKKHSLRLLVIDPLMSVVGKEADAAREADMRDMLEPLLALGDRLGCLILGLMHFNKNTGADILDRIMNSKAFSAVSRHTLMVGYDPSDVEGRRIMLCSFKSNVWKTGDGMSFDKESAGIGVKRRDGNEGTIGIVSLKGIHEGVDARDCLDPPATAVSGGVKELLTDAMGDIDGVYDKTAINKILAGQKEWEVRKAEKELGVYKRNMHGRWHTAWSDAALDAHQAEYKATGMCKMDGVLSLLPTAVELPLEYAEVQLDDYEGE